MRLLLLLLLSPFLSLPAQDTLALAPVTVTAYRADVPAERLAASVAVLDRPALQHYAAEDLVPAFSRVAGVRFEQRAPGSYRVSVRGSTLRSPFGVRNLKVYWNGIPLTEPGGDTQLNFLDPANVDRAELVRGPAGSLYGAGTAGTLLLYTDSLRHRAGAEMAGGSFGTFRARAQVRGRDEGAGVVRYAHQRTDGYRDHSSLSRHTVQGGVGLGRALRLNALYTRLSYDLPGGLTAEQLAENRRQARPGSAATNASINYHNLLLGLTHRGGRRGWTHEATGYATGFYFDHPFNFDYKRETNLGTGGRALLERTLSVNRAPGYAGSTLKLSVGAEYQLQYRMANNFTNADARPGELNFSDEIDTRQGLVFAQAALTTPGGWRLTAGLSANRLRYAVDRTFAADGNAGRQDSDFGFALSPRLALLRELGPVNVYASVAGGFSPPTLDEFRTNEGSVNVGLRPERGVNYELGAKGRSGAWSYELALYHFALTESISAFTDERGTRLFRNAGETRQRGVEVSGSYRPTRRLQLGANYTFQDFVYRDYVRDGTDVSGQPLPGAAPHVVNLLADLTLSGGFTVQLHHNYTAAIPLNDANTVFGNAYHLLRARLAYRTGRWEVFASGTNLLDQEYSLGNDLNPRFGARYFQPAAGVGGIVGVRWGL